MANSSDHSEAATEEETLLEFPCSFPLKIFGRKAASFPDDMLSLVKELSVSEETPELNIRPSKNGNYQAITITITATSKAELDTIYQALTAHDDVVMAL